MQTMKSLTEMQQEAIDEILSLPEQGKRAMAYGMTPLNRKLRSVRRVHKDFLYAMIREGFTSIQAEAAWGDVRDMAVLEHGAEEQS